jgi:hypothetical protein
LPALIASSWAAKYGLDGSCHQLHQRRPRFGDQPHRLILRFGLEQSKLLQWIPPFWNLIQTKG